MAKLHHILIGAGLLAGAQFASAQGTADLSIQPTQPAAETTLPADVSGATATPGTADSGAGSGGLVVGTIIQTSPPTQGQSAAAMSNDPFVQRREARAQARKEYRERRQEARQQYQEDKRAADSLIYQQSGR